ncbi:pentapeptide repeat-containing protein [Rothia sp. P13129]|uniref:pentapeptide repeat-containing protein n=1 Tax=Rothia sp. P13129 TaxID=3402664 RepID=UPI003AC30203
MGSIVQLSLIFFIKDRINYYIGKIIYYIIPLFTFIISIGIWVLIWATADGNEHWRDVRQGIITVFAGLIGVIGAFATLAVNYENHEQNRNITTVKDLNERLHEILKNRHNSEDNNARASSYFQLAGLYKDWGLLGKNSEIIDAQRKIQQKNILKLIFGTVPQGEQEQKKNTRSFLERTTLNSVIADIFPKVSDTDEDKKSFEPFDLQYADLSRLNFGSVFFPEESNLSHADLIVADLQGADLQYAKLQVTDLQYAKLQNANLQNAKLQNAKLQNANLQNAKLQNANLWGANLQEVNLWAANLQNAKLQVTDLQYANLQNAKLQNANLQNANLQNAKLQNANLCGANLWLSDLQNANLQNANLQDANLQDANLQNAKLQNANLYNVKNLTAEQLAQAQNIKSIETRKWDLLTGEYSEEDQDLKNLIQEALEIQKQRKNSQPDT